MKPSPFLDQALEYVLYNYRWIFVCLFLLPASVLFDLYSYVRNYVVFKLSSAAHAHDSKVRHVQNQVLDWNKNGRKKQMCTGRPTWMTMSFRHAVYKKKLTNIDINLVDILEVDTDRKIVRVEPLVTMGQVTSTLLGLGWTLPVVPELDDLTVGGLIMGTGVETSGHKYGLFQHTCVAYDLVLADGSLVHCSQTENVDLFHSIPWSYGSLGFLVSAEIMIVPAKPYVKLQYLPHTSLQTFHQEFTVECNKTDNDFVEGIIFDENRAVLMVANFADAPEDKQKVNSIGYFYKPWFFKHVEEKLVDHVAATEYIPLRHYYHRHTRSLFWELQDIIAFGNHALFRYLLGWAVPPKVSFLKITQPQTVKRLYEQHHVIQDLLIPVEETVNAVKLIHNLVKIYPLWVCPMKVSQRPGVLQTASKQDHLYIDLGIYGVAATTNYQPAETTRAMEKYVRDVNGFQMLYADSYMTREEFRCMFNHNLHDLMRKKYHCTDAFPDIYDKVCKDARQ